MGWDDEDELEANVHKLLGPHCVSSQNDVALSSLQVVPLRS